VDFNLDWLIKGSVLKLPGHQVDRLKANKQESRMERFQPEKVGSEVVGGLRQYWSGSQVIRLEFLMHGDVSNG
jgi:hypothetical protein